MAVMVDRDFWQGRSVFVTGHTGFKGGWLTTWLCDMGARVAGYGLKPDTDPSYFARLGLAERIASCIGDVRHDHDVLTAMQDSAPDVVFHLAAQPLVRRSYRLPIDTLATNVMGTAHVLEAARHTPSVRAVVVVTSDKCYDNDGRGDGYRERDPLGGHDPYSASKAAAELVVAAYRRSFFDGDGAPGVASVRAGNVIGGGDWAEDRLVPDAVRALERSEPIVVRNPGAVRPWQHVLEPLAGYLMLAQRLVSGGGRWADAWNFGPRHDDAVSVGTLVDLVIRAYGSGSWRHAAPPTPVHEAAVLRLDWSHAAERLGWHPVFTLPEAVRLTMDWYAAARRLHSGGALHEVSVEQIRGYERRRRDAAAR